MCLNEMLICNDLFKQVYIVKEQKKKNTLAASWNIHSHSCVDQKTKQNKQTNKTKQNTGVYYHYSSNRDLSHFISAWLPLQNKITFLQVTFASHTEHTMSPANINKQRWHAIIFNVIPTSPSTHRMCINPQIRPAIGKECPYPSPSGCFSILKKFYLSLSACGNNDD